MTYKQGFTWSKIKWVNVETDKYADSTKESQGFKSSLPPASNKVDNKQSSVYQKVLGICKYVIRVIPKIKENGLQR